MDWKEAIEGFLASMRLDRGASPRTIEAYRRDLSSFAASPSCSKLKPGSIAEKELEDFLASLSRQGLEPSSIARKASALRQFFRYLCFEHGLLTSPAERIESPKQVSKLPKSLSQEEITSLLETAGKGLPYLREKKSEALRSRDRAMIGLLYAAGLRVSELVGLDGGDVDLRSGVVRVRGKGGKERLVPFAKEAGDWVAAWTGDYRPKLAKEGVTRMFVNSNGLPLSRQGFWGLLKNLGQEAGLPGARLSPHVLRHSFATHLLEGGMGLRSLQLLLGHADLSTTQLYTKVTPSHLQDTHRKFHPRGGPK